MHAGILVGLILCACGVPAMSSCVMHCHVQQMLFFFFQISLPLMLFTFALPWWSLSLGGGWVWHRCEYPTASILCILTNYGSLDNRWWLIPVFFSFKYRFCGWNSGPQALSLVRQALYQVSRNGVPDPLRCIRMMSSCDSCCCERIPEMENYIDVYGFIVMEAGMSEDIVPAPGEGPCEPHSYCGTKRGKRAHVWKKRKQSYHLIKKVTI